ncbi:MAG: hypothetical protein SangKO_030480 [Sandaracinaceae bacterium]
MTAVAPIEMPMVMLVTTIATGKVKPIAASSCGPSCPTQKVSTMLKNRTAAMPTIIGSVSRTSVLPTGPSRSRRCRSGSFVTAAF